MGVLTIRLPDSLHDRVRKLAAAEGISMNRFVMLAVAEKVTRLDEFIPLLLAESEPEDIAWAKEEIERRMALDLS